MLQLEVPIGPSEWDEEKEEFVIPATKTLQLEHSLVSLSKWESKWCKPFFSREEKTAEELLDYIQMMTLTEDVSSEVWNNLTKENINDIRAYLDAPMTATTFSKNAKTGNSREIITSELIYYWMIALQIPDRFESWHINRLLTLIRVCEIKNSPPKKYGKGDLMRRNAALNAQRRARMNSKG